MSYIKHGFGQWNSCQIKTKFNNRKRILFVLKVYLRFWNLVASHLLGSHDKLDYWKVHIRGFEMNTKKTKKLQQSTLTHTCLLLYCNCFSFPLTTHFTYESLFLVPSKTWFQSVAIVQEQCTFWVSGTICDTNNPYLLKVPRFWQDESCNFLNPINHKQFHLLFKIDTMIAWFKLQPPSFIQKLFHI